MQKPKAPCKDCKEREVGCHIRCEKYQQYVADNETYHRELNANKSKSKCFGYKGGGKTWIR